MASSSSFPAGAPPPLGAPVSEKLTRENYIIWKAQVMPAIRGSNLVAILDGTLQPPRATMEVVKDDKTKEAVPTLSMRSGWRRISNSCCTSSTRSLPTSSPKSRPSLLLRLSGQRWRRCSRHNLVPGSPISSCSLQTARKAV